MNYSESYNDPRWQERRHEIIQRDEYMCTNCESQKNLQVHHKIYYKDRNIWEYNDNELTTLCKICHEDITKLIRDSLDIVRLTSHNSDMAEHLNKILNNLNLITDWNLLHIINKRVIEEIEKRTEYRFKGELVYPEKNRLMDVIDIDI